MDESRLTEQKYTELDYLFQRIEMAKSGQEFKNFRDDSSATLSTTPAIGIATPATAIPTPAAQWGQPLQLEDELQESSSMGDAIVNPCPWNTVTRRLRRHRRFTFSQETPPPAPPSTPTSSSMMTLAAAHHAGGGGGGGSSSNGAPHCSNGTNGTGDYDAQCLNFNLLYILDYAPQYKKKLKEQKRTDSELADLFKVITITGNSTSGSGSASSSSNSSTAHQLHSAAARALKFSSLSERGICAASRNIRKLDSATKIFKIHRNPKEFIREPDEDSVSAPEYDTEEEDVRHRRLRLKPLRRIVRTGLYCKRLQRFDNSGSKSMVGERLQEVVDSFDDMSFADF